MMETSVMEGDRIVTEERGPGRRTTGPESADLIVVGGGPAGLFCAVRAANPGRRVLLLEKMPSPGRKLLLSGSGQCNLTHEGDVASFLTRYGDHGAFLKPALLNFSNRDLMSFFADRGVRFETEPGGKVFPVSRKSAEILAVLLTEASGRHVEIRAGEPVLDISKPDDRFAIRTARGLYRADRAVVATGGITYPQTGSTGDGYDFARRLRHAVTNTGPALAAVECADGRFSDLAGLSFADAVVSIHREGRKIRDHAGDILLTHAGLSGPGILDASRFIRPNDLLRISFLPGLDAKATKAAVLDSIAATGHRRIRTVLSSLGLPIRFAGKLLVLAGLPPDLTGAHLTRDARAALVELITACPFTVARLAGLREAMVTRGGVALREINPKTMESRIVPGLFFAGEVLDIDGDTGGYNLQAAFSTGALAARAAG
jgi:predicted Rossmann fold flavoprotein